MNRRATQLASVGLLLSLIGGALQAQGGQSPQVRRGEHLARLICSTCHVVAHDQEFPPGLEIRTPSFYQIAARPDVSTQSLRRFITGTHWDERTIPMTMPDQHLTEEQVQALIHYILSLRPAPNPQSTSQPRTQPAP